MQNTAGEKVDLYIPRKCSATNRLLTAKDHASVQIKIGNVDHNGIYTGESTTFALAGAVRKTGKGDAALNRLCSKSGLLKTVLEQPQL